MNNESILYETKRYRCLVYHQIQTTDIYLTMCGIESCMPGKIFRTKDRAGYHLHVILSGKGTLCVNGNKENLHFGQMFVTKPGEDTWYVPDKEDPWVYCWMAFDGKIARTYVEDAGFIKGVNSLNCHLDQEKFYEQVKRILAQPELTLSSNLVRLAALLEYIALAIESNEMVQEHIIRSPEYSPDIYVEYAMDFIKNNYTNVRIGDVARYIGIHRSYLTSIFKKKLGISPQEYLMQYKLKQSCTLLLETDLAIQEIAQRVGYDNPLTFSKVFKNVYGLSPKNYRLDNKKKESDNEHPLQ